MNKSQALKEAVKLFGPDAVVIDEGKRNASTPERRDAARAALQAFHKLTDAEKKARRKERDDLLGELYRYRFKIAIHHGFAIGIRGSGDTWEGAFDDYHNRYRKLAA